MVEQPNIPQYEESIKNLKKLSEIRELRAKEVLMAGNPQLLSEEEFIVPSSNGKDNYRVVHLDSWSCNCLDFKNRCQKLGIYCKHIKALQLFLKLRSNQEVKDFDILQIAQEEGNCPFCSSEKVTKQGYRINKSGKKQKFKCLECKKYFVLDPVKYHKATAKIITLTMDLYYKGLSLRDITDTLKQFYGMNLHHETIRRWIMKFTKLMDDYTKKFKPELSDTWHIDEQMVKSGKDWLYSWNILDSKTRFLIANNVTKSRSIEEAREVLQKAKKTTDKIPRVFITDGLKSYNKALSKEYHTTKGRHLSKPLHLSNVGIRDEVNNNLVERYHNEFRDFDKVRRGFKTDNTTQDWNDNFRFYHNFIKKHMALDGLTPSQKANIELNFSSNRWMSLLNISMKKKKKKNV